MNYADIKIADVANGQGVRVSLFVSGCNHHCKGCFNAQAWDFNYGKEFKEEETERIINELKHPYDIRAFAFRRRALRIQKSTGIVTIVKKNKRGVAREKYLVLYRI